MGRKTLLQTSQVFTVSNKYFPSYGLISPWMVSKFMVDFTEEELTRLSQRCDIIFQQADDLPRSRQRLVVLVQSGDIAGEEGPGLPPHYFSILGNFL